MKQSEWLDLIKQKLEIEFEIEVELSVIDRLLVCTPQGGKMENEAYLQRSVFYIRHLMKERLNKC